MTTAAPNRPANAAGLPAIAAPRAGRGSMGTRHDPRRRRIGEVLVEQHVIDQVQLEACLAEQSRTTDPKKRPRLGKLVVNKGLATEKQVAQALASALGLQIVELGRMTPDPLVARILPKAVSDRHGVMVIAKEGNSLRVAMSDPTNIVALDDVRAYTKASDLSIVVTIESELRQALGKVWSSGEADHLATELASDGGPRLSAADLAEEISAADASDGPIVKMVDVLFADAVHQRASDIHIEPQQGELRIRFRVDGLLRDVMNLPKSSASSLVSRVKIISGLDIAERRRPQDGRARLTIDGTQMDARISTLPTLHGEKVVIRLLAKASDLKNLKDIGMEQWQLEELLTTLNQPQGLVLITGPTGSGKTSTLYGGLNQIRTPERNIITLEDPVEIGLNGINQVQINVKAGLTFAAGLRSVLRQDPDVVLVGEIRDLETAGLALEASMTGHLVLSTLHTNDAVSAVTRLVDMGVEPFLIGSSLALVIAQRLARRPCEECSVPYTPSPRTLQLLGLVEKDLEGSKARRGKGCPNCDGTGYKGRVGVYEVLPITAKLRQVMLATPEERPIAAAAREAGMVNLRSAGITKALAGDTTFEEVVRIAQTDSHEGGKRCTNCTYRLEDDMLCCPRCSTNVDRGHCRACDKPLQSDWHTCPYCRTDVEHHHVAARDDSVTEASLPRVLVVDPDPGVRDFLEQALQDTCQVDGAGSADEALRLLSLNDFDGIVLDLALPDLPGLEMLRIVREDPRTGTVPILLFTGIGDERMELEARTTGADDWLTKPCDPDELITRLLTLVQPRLLV